MEQDVTTQSTATRAPEADPTAAATPEAAEAFAIEAARTAADLNCSDVLILNVTGLSPLTHYLVIATGTSDRQMRSVADEIADAGKKTGFRRYGTDEDKAATWIVADFVEVVVHLFEPSTRGYYDLEMLWGDATQVSWHRAQRGAK